MPNGHRGGLEHPAGQPEPAPGDRPDRFARSMRFRSATSSSIRTRAVKTAAAYAAEPAGPGSRGADHGPTIASSCRTSPSRRGGHRERRPQGAASGSFSGRAVSPAAPSPPARRARARHCWASQRATTAASCRVDLPTQRQGRQGFEPQKVATVDGRTYEGCIVRGSGTEIELRDAQGRTTVLLKKDIDDRARGEARSCPPASSTPSQFPNLPRCWRTSSH